MIDCRRGRTRDYSKSRTPRAGLKTKTALCNWQGRGVTSGTAVEDEVVLDGPREDERGSLAARGPAASSSRRAPAHDSPANAHDVCKTKSILIHRTTSTEQAAVEEATR